MSSNNYKSTSRNKYLHN